MHAGTVDVVFLRNTFDLKRYAHAHGWGVQDMSLPLSRRTSPGELFKPCDVELGAMGEAAKLILRSKLKLDSAWEP